MDYYIRYINLPHTVKGVTVLDADGFCNVYINARLSLSCQQEALEHEIRHITNDDFFNGDTLEDIEARANGDKN